MELQEYIQEIKLELTGGVLELEIPDETLVLVVNKAFREVQRYIDTPKLITVPFVPCIDLAGFNVSAVTKVYRTEGYLGDTTSGMASSATDPMYASMWMAFTNGGTMYNLQDYVLNYLSYNTLLQMRNTTTTDMAFREDKNAKKLYINTASETPDFVTIEYIPVYQNVNEITSDYWVDILIRLAVALAKVALGRIRTRYTQSGALWAQDGSTILEEGQNELTNLRETLRLNRQLCYPID